MYLKLTNLEIDILEFGLQQIQLLLYQTPNKIKVVHLVFVLH